MKERVFDVAIKHPIWVLLASIILVVAAAAGAKNLVFKSDYRVFFSEENPQLTSFESMQKVYNKSDNVAFIIAPKEGSIFTPERLAAIHELTLQSWQVPYSTRVDSITNFQHTVAEDDDLIVEDLVLDPETLVQADMPRLKELATNDPLMRSKLISPEGHVSVVNITIQLPGINPVAEVPEVVSKIRDLEAQFIKANPEVDLYLSGMVMMNNSFAEASQNDFSTLVPLMFLIVIVAIIFLLRTFSGALATIIIIIFTILSTMGLAGWTGFYLTGPSISTPTVVMTLAVADCVHILASFFYELRQGEEKSKALRTSLRINFSPVFLTSATTAIGFLSMNFSDSPPFRDLGNMVAAGVMIAFVLSITLFPALLMLLPIKVKPQKEEKSALMDRLSAFVIAKRNILLPSMTVIILAMVVFVPFNKLNDDFVKYFDKTVPFRQATDFMQDNLSGLTSIEISVNTGESSGINAPAYLNTLENFSQWLRAQPETDHVSTLTDIVKRLNKNMHGDDPAYYKLPENRELAAQYLLLYEMSLPYGLDLNNQLNVDKSSSRIVGTFKNLTSNEQVELEKRLYKWFADNASQYTVQIASPTLMFAHIGQRNIQSMLIGITFALILISFLLGIALKSVRYGLISLLPNLAPAAMGFGIWYFIDGQVGLALSVVAGMTLGIVVDDTVHFLSKYRHARIDKGKNSAQAVQYAFASVGRALWITTFVLVAGFLVLAQSSFKINADMGLLTAITILIALVVDFLFLPPLLMKLDSNTNDQITNENTQGETDASSTKTA
ncbi:efflux RND transporter permease subunit [Neptunomonas japonica]|uniref:RND family efflux transporter n=1 Tax=Neptunomonas japonica JAMM 1380 TaxID=1441457 RepID=A0A7R6PGZ3_9GAMM|nr:MMPL family transporter [Neptunomonas japonica]BBB30022.1 RND family efflux transporter [Neptunomonas japonica JAMM 1380]